MSQRNQISKDKKNESEGICAGVRHELVRLSHIVYVPKPFHPGPNANECKKVYSTSGLISGSAGKLALVVLEVWSEMLLCSLTYATGCRTFKKATLTSFTFFASLGLFKVPWPGIFH